jgi:hypothetical protein
MRNVAWLFIVVGTWCVPSTVRAADSTPAQEREALDEALRLAGPQLYRHLPIVLIATLPGIVSPGAEAWTVYDEYGTGDRIFVYTRSRTFRCASASRSDQDQCLLRLASIIVHEAWHLRHGRDEAGAYEAQLAFLRLTEASAFLQLSETASQDIREVRRARDRALADRRNANRQPGTGSGEHSSPGTAAYSPR